MKRIVWLLAGLAVLHAQAGELYRWVDDAGKVHYGDAQARDAAKNVAESDMVRLSSKPASGEELPYQTQQARNKFPVTLYVSDNCGAPCTSARALLNKRGIPYTEKLLNTKAAIDEFRKLSGSDDAPTLAVGNTYLKGYLADAWQNELDVAGYPKAAPYRALVPATPAASAVAPAYPFAR